MTHYGYIEVAALSSEGIATSTRFVQPENLPPTSSAAKYHSLRVYLQVQVWKGESMLGPHLHPQNIGWKAVEGKVLPGQCDIDVAPKAPLKVVRCNSKMGCDTLRCSCRKAGLDCSTGCGECRDICVNMYGNITEDNEYEEDTYVVMLCRIILRSCKSH